MSDPKLIDFDAFRAEVDQATIPVRVSGVVYQVPQTPPAAAVLDALRLQKQGAATIGPEAVFALATAVLGDAADEIIRVARLSVPELMQLVTHVAQAQADAVTPPPNRQTRRAKTPRNRSTSSRAGLSSKRTSSANTGSTSAQA